VPGRAAVVRYPCSLAAAWRSRGDPWLCGPASRPGCLCRQRLIEPSVVAVTSVLGHPDIVVKPDLLSSQRWSTSRLLGPSVAPWEKRNRHTGSGDRRVWAEAPTVLSVMARAGRESGWIDGGGVVALRQRMSTDRGGCRIAADVTSPFSGRSWARSKRPNRGHSDPEPMRRGRGEMEGVRHDSSRGGDTRYVCADPAGEERHIRGWRLPMRRT
jgi:hypothetical protein